MQTTDLTYQTIISGPYKVEYKAVIAGQTYYNGDMRIAFPEISSSLFEKFGIGNAVAASLRITLVPKGVIPTMAEIDLYYRVTNGVNDSSWKPKGVYFIDTRKADKNGVMTFEAYDSMLPWATTGRGSGGHGTHSDATAAQAMARSESYDVLIADKRAKLDALYDIVGDCGRVLMRLGDALGDECSLALELYYVDVAYTWSDVADEMGVTRRQLSRIRDKSYEWIEENCDAHLRGTRKVLV